MRRRRNLHVSIEPEAVRLLRATAAYLGTPVAAVLEAAIRSYCTAEIVAMTTPTTH